jgi:hypothetical protein
MGNAGGQAGNLCPTPRTSPLTFSVDKGLLGGMEEILAVDEGEGPFDGRLNGHVPPHAQK